jgi:hypothetical protein
MSAFLASVSAYAVFSLLVVSAQAHGRNMTGFISAIATQSVIPRRAITAVALAVFAAELLIGAAGLLAVFLLPAPAMLRMAALAAAALFLIYTLYNWYLGRARPGSPCGCSQRPLPVSTWVVVRSGLLLAFATLVTAAPASILSPTDAPSSATIVTLAALFFATVIWYLPDALANSSPLDIAKEADDR